MRSHSIHGRQRMPQKQTPEQVRELHLERSGDNCGLLMAKVEHDDALNNGSKYTTAVDNQNNLRNEYYDSCHHPILLVGPSPSMSRLKTSLLSSGSCSP
jgi:hypothetical protein